MVLACCVAREASVVHDGTVTRLARPSFLPMRGSNVKG